MNNTGCHRKICVRPYIPGGGIYSCRLFEGLPVILLGVFLLISCATHALLHDQVEITPTYALPPATEGEIFHLAERLAQESNRENSTFLTIPDNMEALRWRLLLVDLARQSIDIQSFLWNGDESGDLLGLHLLDAADRGVRVRVLVDDLFLLKSDDDISILNSHPNVEIRIFNPWRKRGSLFQRGLEFLGNLERLNQRMHNKMFVVDNHAAIVGGRNIGNAYFGLSDNYNFRDFEIVGFGPVVEEISESFDIYWNDDWATPGAAFARPGKTLQSLAILRSQLTDELADSEKIIAADLDEPSQWRPYLDRLTGKNGVNRVWVVYDDPPSAVANDEGVRKVEKLRDLDADISKELLIASPYFIPTEPFLEEIHRLVQQGVRVRIITNSLASTNHTIVNSGYRQWRRKLLKAGVELYEYRAGAEDITEVVAPGLQGRFQTLHTKTFVIDDEVVYVGSLNMDPRSFHINTEMGLLIQYPALAKRVIAMLERDMKPENSWHVTLDEEGSIVWHSAAGTIYIQPTRYLGQRIVDFFYGLLPIKEHL